MTFLTQGSKSIIGADEIILSVPNSGKAVIFGVVGDDFKKLGVYPKERAEEIISDIFEEAEPNATVFISNRRLRSRMEKLVS